MCQENKIMRFLELGKLITTRVPRSNETRIEITIKFGAPLIQTSFWIMGFNVKP